MDQGVSKATNAKVSATGGAQRLNTENPASSSATSAVQSASAFPLVSMATKESAPATTTGRPRKGDPNAPNDLLPSSSPPPQPSSLYLRTYLLACLLNLFCWVWQQSVAPPSLPTTCIFF
ncbi:uncharacterized protein A4U43_C03F440 [Asparagus officinalis]|uniref:Uncharacterized protein n=1 Tax=Asparagus officinalis TaxID=4686 RepID=A0A5P1F6S0_ASPOF|nr:uncharacterized protein A4U43_C03F440 [Asparagus officinalis]